MADTPIPNVPDVPPDYIDVAPKNAKPVRPENGDVAATVRVRTDESSSRHREGECEPNVPDAAPDFLGKKEAAALLEKRPQAPEAELEAGGWLAGRWLRFGYAALLLAVVALFGVYVFSQAISALALASTLPEWQQYLLLIPLALCGLLLLLAVLGLARSWFRLRRVRQVDMAALEELKKRAETRRDGMERYQTAREALGKYLRDYPLGGRNSENLAKVGLNDSVLDTLADARKYLEGRDVDSQAWIGDFRDMFQKPIDQAAAARVNSWALKAAGCVIASPLPLLDAILVLSISLRMIRDLCIVYNVRSGGAASFLLFTRAVRNAFIAGLADEAGGAAGEIIGEEVSGFLGEGVMSTLGASAARVAIPKLGEGALNGLFMRRLGKATMRLLRPLSY